jgi:hypothetical protein
MKPKIISQTKNKFSKVRTLQVEYKNNIYELELISRYYPGTCYVWIYIDGEQINDPYPYYNISLKWIKWYIESYINRKKSKTGD